ncbi:gamma-mobile-trio protein GmtX [Acidovorax delafieldii]|uniref:gamma-mobile-trio protein GmtX n=1 Tax=Acidovorax delafieldii TaxID=47920 RepID=UPI003ECDFC52
MQQSLHPDELLQKLLENTVNEKHKELLRDLHRVCQAQSKTSKDFRLNTIGKICEATGLFKARILYNRASENHRALIAAWAKFSGAIKLENKPLVSESERLLGIPDLALRSYVQTSLVQLGRKTAEVALLKSQLQIQVHQLQRPFAPNESPSVLNLTLTPAEVEALGRAIDGSFLEGEGWVEGATGEIRNQTGRTLYSPGYATAVRKVLKMVGAVGQTRSRR